MQLLPGDIAACFGTDWTSRGISLGTASLFAPRGLRIGPSHLALMCQLNGDIAWVESTTFCPSHCLVRQQSVSGAQAHRPRDRMNDYINEGGKVAIYRLVPISSLSDRESVLLTTILIQHFVCREIDYDFRGAILSGTRAFQLTRFFPGANLNDLFCSELVAAVLMRLNRMNHSNPTRFNPARLLRQLVRSGVYSLHQTIKLPQ